MEFLLILAILVIFFAFGVINYRDSRQKADDLVADSRRFNGQ